MYSYRGVTHGGITNTVEDENHIIRNYFNQLGFSKGELTTFTLYPSAPPQGYWMPDNRLGLYLGTGMFELTDAERELIKYPEGFPNATTTALNWLVIGSVLEDVPMLRAKNHFHDPTTLQGLSDVLSGTSARNWAFNDMRMEFMWSGDENHGNIRLYQYKALTAQTEEERGHWWALTLFGVGTVMHI